MIDVAPRGSAVRLPGGLLVNPEPARQLREAVALFIAKAAHQTAPTVAQPRSAATAECPPSHAPVAQAVRTMRWQPVAPAVRPVVVVVPVALFSLLVKMVLPVVTVE